MAARFRANTVLFLLGLLLSGAGAAHAQAISPPLGPPSAAPAPADASAPLLALVREKRWLEVVQLATSLSRQHPSDPSIFYWLGIARLQLHQPIPAVLALRGAEKLGLHSAVFHEGLGLAYYDLNQYLLFEQQMEQASQAEALDYKPYYYLGLYRLTIRSDPARALPLFEQATQLEPGDWKSLYQEGYCLEQLGKLGEARTRYDRAITLVEKSGESFGWPFQGIARLMLDDDPSAALDLARRAVSLEPNEPSNHLLLARVYERLGKLPEAVHEAQLAVAQNSTDAATRYALYKLYRASGDSRAAKELTTFNEITKLYGTN